MEIKVEKNVPLPIGRKQSKVALPFLEMNVTDSFYVELPTRMVRYHIRIFNKRYGMLRYKFTTRTENKGSRVWRVE